MNHLSHDQSVFGRDNTLPVPVIGASRVVAFNAAEIEAGVNLGTLTIVGEMPILVRVTVSYDNEVFVPDDVITVEVNGVSVASTQFSVDLAASSAVSLLFSISESGEIIVDVNPQGVAAEAGWAALEIVGEQY